MGIHATAKLFYGYDLRNNDGESPLSDDDGDFDSESFIDEKLGTKEQPYEVRKAAREAFGVEFIIHNSYDYSCYGLAVSESVVRSYQGSCTSVAKALLKHGDEWQVMLDRAVGKLGLNMERAKGPDWFVCSLMG